jgi:hypothetical protein
MNPECIVCQRPSKYCCRTCRQPICGVVCLKKSRRFIKLDQCICIICDGSSALCCNTCHQLICSTTCLELSRNPIDAVGTKQTRGKKKPWGRQLTLEEQARRRAAAAAPPAQLAPPIATTEQDPLRLPRKFAQLSLEDTLARKGQTLVQPRPPSSPTQMRLEQMGPHWEAYSKAQDQLRHRQYVEPRNQPNVPTGQSKLSLTPHETANEK